MGLQIGFSHSTSRVHFTPVHTFKYFPDTFGVSPVAQSVKNLPTMQETGSDPWIGKIPCRRKWKPTPVILPGKFHGRRSLVGYSPWDLKESDMTKQLHFMKKKGKWFQFLLHLSFSTGNPLGLLVFGGSHFCLGEKQWCFGF